MHTHINILHKWKHTIHTGVPCFCKSNVLYGLFQTFMLACTLFFLTIAQCPMVAMPQFISPGSYCTELRTNPSFGCDIHTQPFVNMLVYVGSMPKMELLCHRTFAFLIWLDVAKLLSKEGVPFHFIFPLAVYRRTSPHPLKRSPLKISNSHILHITKLSQGDGFLNERPKFYKLETVWTPQRCQIMSIDMNLSLMMTLCASISSEIFVNHTNSGNFTHKSVIEGGDSLNPT